MGQKKRSDAAVIPATDPVTETDSATDSRFIPAGDADVVAHFTEGEHTAAQLPQALDEYEGTGFDRVLTDAMTLRGTLHQAGWMFDTSVGDGDFAVFTTARTVDGAPSLSMGVDWPTNPITGLPRARYDIEVSAPLTPAKVGAGEDAEELDHEPRTAQTAGLLTSETEFVPHASAVKDRNPDAWPEELQGRRFDPDEELDAFLAAADAEA